MEYGKQQQQNGWRSVGRFLRPVVIAASLTLLAFFFMQGLPLAQTLPRRTDLVSALVIQNGEHKLLMEQEEIVSAAEVAANYGTNAARALYFGFMTLDAAGRFAPKRLVSREEGAVILDRVADFAGL